MDKIGLFKGKEISTMTREELLEFAEWAGKKISELEMEKRVPYQILSIPCSSVV